MRFGSGRGDTFLGLDPWSGEGASAVSAGALLLRMVFGPHRCRACPLDSERPRAYRLGLMETSGESQNNPPANAPPADALEVAQMRTPNPAMTDEQMRSYLTEVGARLEARGLVGEIVLAGGAVMVMVLHARGGSRDIDAVFVEEASAIREAARDVAQTHGLPAVWLNDHVRMFVAPDAPTVDFFVVPGLRVRMVRLDYLFYMKAWAGDPIDQRDLRVIAAALELTGERQANEIVSGFSAGQLPRDVQILLESLFE